MYTNEMRSLVKPILAAFFAVLLAAGPAAAHAADQGFVLLLPTTAYITGGTLTVAFTILLLAKIAPQRLSTVFRPRPMPLRIDLRSWLPWSQLCAALCLGVLILIGLQGPTDPQANLMPLVLWTVWWMLLFVVQALVFDVWSWINPWPAVHRLLWPDDVGKFTLHERLSIWPAVVLMMAFQGFVLADTAPNDPSRLATFALGYWAFTLVGMTLFGRDPWLRQVECLSLIHI